MGGELFIGDNVMMGIDVIILTREHYHNDVNIPMICQGSYASKVIIEDDVYIGTRSVILPEVRIGEGVIVGTGAVVTEDVPPYSIVGGVPAKVLKMRNEHRSSTPQSFANRGEIK